MTDIFVINVIILINVITFSNQEVAEICYLKLNLVLVAMEVRDHQDLVLFSPDSESRSYQIIIMINEYLNILLVEMNVRYHNTFIFHQTVSNFIIISLLREPTPYQFSCFFIKLIKGGGGPFPFIKIYVVDFIYSGGLWQHEIGIEKVF